MLFLLTGDVQIGKSRWLEKLVSELAEHGVPSYGVLAPGIWVASEREGANADGFEKLGIDNVLLPEGQRMPFAKRADLAEASGSLEAATQSERAQLGWRISDAAIDQVNAHFAQLRAQAKANARSSLLVVDELGRLELLRGEGLTEAMSLLSEGPCAQLPHALVVVRDVLADQAEKRLASAWSGCLRIGPDEEGRATLMDAFDLT